MVLNVCVSDDAVPVPRRQTAKATKTSGAAEAIKFEEKPSCVGVDF